MAALLLALAALLSPTVARAEGSVVYVSNDGTGDDTAAELPTKLTSALIEKFNVNGSTTQKFTFTVTLTHADGTPVTEIDGTYGDMSFSDGVATFTLAHGERAKAVDLPAGLRWTVEEAPVEDYTASCTQANGTIEKD